MFVVVGARDFSPEITVLPIGTEVPCPDRVPPQNLIYRAEGRVVNRAVVDFAHIFRQVRHFRIEFLRKRYKIAAL